MLKRVIAAATVAIVTPLAVAATALATTAQATTAQATTAQVRAKAGTVTGYKGKCLDDSKSSTTNGNKVDIWSCNGTTAQEWTFSNHQLSVLGKCLDDSSQGGAGSTLVIWTCNGHKAQTWAHFSNGEYQLKLNKLCLTDPSDSTTNGTQVKIHVCKDNADQKWSKP
jgi:chitinase